MLMLLKPNRSMEYACVMNATSTGTRLPNRHAQGEIGVSKMDAVGGIKLLDHVLNKG